MDEVGQRFRLRDSRRAEGVGRAGRERIRVREVRQVVGDVAQHSNNAVGGSFRVAPIAGDPVSNPLVQVLDDAGEGLDLRR